ncbi:MAG: 16S rRNA (cytidine(1402)-2'-O)-methyltransferase, partial [Methylorubrum extorquens]
MTQRLDKRPEGAPRSPATFTAFGLAAEAESLAPGLYVVATPIG